MILLISTMNQGLALLILLAAAVLEAGGDALVRKGLHSGILVEKVLFILVGGMTLLSYGINYTGIFDTKYCCCISLVISLILSAKLIVSTIFILFFF